MDHKALGKAILAIAIPKKDSEDSGDDAESTVVDASKAVMAALGKKDATDDEAKEFAMAMKDFMDACEMDAQEDSSDPADKEEY